MGVAEEEESQGQQTSSCLLSARELRQGHLCMHTCILQLRAGCCNDNTRAQTQQHCQRASIVALAAGRHVKYTHTRTGGAPRATRGSTTSVAAAWAKILRNPLLLDRLTACTGAATCNGCPIALAFAGVCRGATVLLLLPLKPPHLPLSASERFRDGIMGVRASRMGRGMNR